MTASRIALALRRWVDSGAVPDPAADALPRGVDWPRVLPFVAVHLGCLGVFWTGYSATAISAAVALYVLRMLSR